MYKSEKKTLVSVLAAFFFLLGVCFFPGSANAEEYSIKNSYNKVSKDLARIRGLKFKKAVPYSIKSKDFLRKFLLTNIKAEMPEAKMKAYDTALKTFGFVPKTFQTFNFMINLYTDEVAGLYDYNTGQLMLMEGKTEVKGMDKSQEQMMAMYGLNVGDILLIHEMDHAIQDQYFNLKKMLASVKKYKNDDRESAVQSLLEGDATYVMMLYMFDSMSGGSGVDISEFMDMEMVKNMSGDLSMRSGPTFAKAPLYFKRSMVFPYLDGMVFIEKLRKSGGWAKVNNAYTDPPKSTEQILHPDRYLLKDDPISISWIEMPDAIGGWKLLEENTCGEFVIKTMFENFLPLSNYQSIAEGWGGDRFRIYEKGNEHFLMWYLTWDREQDAKEFLKSYIELLKVKYPGLAWTKTSPNKAYLGRIGNDHVYLAINGKDVLLIEGCQPELTQAILKIGWYVKKSR
ncbi:MAG: hypothetical protein LWY06_01320 [Firmicutes bacterium]|nr:hypothetical protein [Bacillota bacterium]